VASYAAPSRERYASRSRVSAESRPEARTELRVQAAKNYDDLPKIATSKSSASQETFVSEQKYNKKEKARSKPEVVVASHRPQPSVKESSRTGTKEVVNRSGKSDKAEGPVTASIFPGLGSSKKSKKESPTIARKPKENSKNKKNKSTKDD
jgi:hypothetical protein